MKTVSVSAALAGRIRCDQRNVAISVDHEDRRGGSGCPFCEPERGKMTRPEGLRADDCLSRVEIHAVGKAVDVQEGRARVVVLRT